MHMIPSWGSFAVHVIPMWGTCDALLMSIWCAYDPHAEHVIPSWCHTMFMRSPCLIHVIPSWCATCNPHSYTISTLLISQYSSVFEEVEKNSLEIWKFEMYSLVMESSELPMLPPPLVIFEHLFYISRWVLHKCRRCCKNKKTKGML